MFQHKFCVIGGKWIDADNKNHLTNSVFCYIESQGREVGWTSSDPLPEPIGNLTCVANPEGILVSGFNQAEELRVYLWSGFSNQWFSNRTQDERKTQTIGGTPAQYQKLQTNFEAINVNLVSGAEIVALPESWIEECSGYH